MDFAARKHILAAMRDTLHQVLERLYSGDRKGLEALYALTSGRVYRTITDILGTNNAAESVLQNVYTNVWQERDEWKSRSGPDQDELCRLARRLALQVHYRAKSGADGSIREEDV
ncbi:MAG: RNA polymerase sigma factor [Henriciella sp.]